jgi:protoporphyrin/coproporphyrin ferrochelatase
VLFSAHGLPKRVVEAGDPYQWQVERTVEQVVRDVRHGRDGAVFDFEICYQSRVGPLQWIGPATDDEIRRAGRDGVGIVMVPIAFVSEHSETLVELDIEYRELAHEHGVPTYERLPALRTHPGFIGGLAALVREAAGWPDGRIGGCGGGRLCPAAWTGCPTGNAAG